MADRIRVMLVDYDPVTQAGLKAMLEAGGAAEVVGIAQETKDVPAKLRALTPDVVITDVRQNGGVDAVEVKKIVERASPKTPVIVITDRESDPYAMNAVEAGISAYLLKKNATAEVLTSVIQIVMRGDTTVISAPLMQSVITSLTDRANHTLSQEVAGGAPLDLTNREVQVLRLLAIGEANTSIAGSLGVSHETVRKHVSRVMLKLGARNRTHAAILAARAGITGDASPAITSEIIRASSTQR